MTYAARINLQNGIEENPAFEWTNYHNNNNELDNYILQKVKFRKEYMKRRQEEQNKREYEKQVQKAGEDVAAAAYKELEKVFKQFK